MGRWRSSLLALGCAALVGCGLIGKDDIGDRAMDSNFVAGEATPVHPPRGERKKVRSVPGATSMQSEPLECNGGAQTVSNLELRVTGPTGVRVRGGCQLRLVNVDLRAKDGVVIEDGELIMVSGSITAEGVGVRASGSASVDLTKVAVGGSTGLQADGQAKVHAKGGSITGSGAAMALRDEASVVLEGTAVDGPVAQAEDAELVRIDAREEQP